MFKKLQQYRDAAVLIVLIGGVAVVKILGG